MAMFRRFEYLNNRSYKTIYETIAKQFLEQFFRKAWIIVGTRVKNGLFIKKGVMISNGLFEETNNQHNFSKIFYN